MIYRLAFLFSLLFLTSKSIIFGQDYLGDALPFFEKKAELYQYWLKQRGLGEVLQVDKIQLSRGGLNLEMLLSIKETDLDRAINLWESMVQQFNTKNSDTNLKTYLYETFVRMMEIDADQGNIQIYVPLQRSVDGEIEYNRCFYVWYWAENKQILEEARVNLCRGPQPVVVEIEFSESWQVNTSEKLAISKTVDAATVFNKIEEFSHQRYDGLGYTKETPSHIDVILKDDYRFEFTVTNIRREILTDEKRSLWCQFVNYWWGNCDDVRRERLEFSFRFIPTKKGYILDGALTGKFGSGVFVPRISGYMDMEPDFLEDYLKPYIRRFEQDLKRYLEKD